MITLGIDVGSLFTKAVMLADDRVLAHRTVPTTGTVDADTLRLIEQLEAETGVKRSELAGIVATGASREFVSAASFCEDTAACTGWAVRELMPHTERVVDVGGQSITAMLLDPDGEVVGIKRNDKCASGSGRFLDVMARAVDVSMEELDRVASGAVEAVPFGAQCGVFVESEVITHVNAGRSPADITAGLCDAVARIVSSQARRLGADRPYTLTGGVARVQTVVQRVDEQLDGDFSPFPMDPGLAAAVGAALLAFPE